MKKKQKLTWTEMNKKQRVIYVLDWVLKGFWLITLCVILLLYCLFTSDCSSDEEAYAESESSGIPSYVTLGAYDTYVDNGDGTATITRQTGYINSSNNSYSSYDCNDSYPYYSFYLWRSYPFAFSSDGLYIVNKDSILSIYDFDFSLDDGYAVSLACSITFASYSELSAYVSDLSIQYKTASSTTEKIILNSATYNSVYNSGVTVGTKIGLSGVFADCTLSGTSYSDVTDPGLEPNGTSYKFSAIQPDYLISGISCSLAYDWCLNNGFIPKYTELSVNFNTPLILYADFYLYTSVVCTSVVYTFSDGRTYVCDYTNALNSDISGYYCWLLPYLDLPSNSGLQTISFATSAGADLMQSYIFYKSDGLSQSYGSGYNNGYSAGYESGSSDGYSSGYSSGYSAGNSDGYSSGYSVGNSDGYDSGKTVGYNNGYESGYQAGFDASGAGGFSWLISSVQSFLSVNFFGDFGLGTLLYVGLGITLVLLFIKMFAV
jgi:hypothetical protein